MWIRSQDKEKLVKCNDIAIKTDSEDGKTIRGYMIIGYFDKETEYEELGTYKIKQRALEVLDEIDGRIALLQTIELAKGDKDSLIAFKNAIGEEKINGLSSPYQMP